MTREDLHGLVTEVRRRQAELDSVEVKAARGGTPQRLYTSLSAFANRVGGGVLLFGLDERSDFSVVGVGDAHRLQEEITHLASADMEPALRPQFVVDEIEGKPVGFFCSVRCPGNVILRTYDLIRALRDTGIPAIGGFQSPMEKEGLGLLLRGQQPVVVCPARSIERMRVPSPWRTPLEEGRLLVVSPFAVQHRRPTAALSETRNRFVANLAGKVVVAYAAEGGKLETLCKELLERKKEVYTLDLPENGHLIAQGAVGRSVDNLAGILR